MKNKSNKIQVLLDAKLVAEVTKKAQQLHTSGDDKFSEGSRYPAQVIARVLTLFVQAAEPANSGHDQTQAGTNQPPQKGTYPGAASNQSGHTAVVDNSKDLATGAGKDQPCIPTPSAGHEQENKTNTISQTNQCSKDNRTPSGSPTTSGNNTSLPNPSTAVHFVADCGDVVAIVRVADTKNAGRLVRHFGFELSATDNVFSNFRKHVGVGAETETERLQRVYAQPRASV